MSLSAGGPQDSDRALLFLKPSFRAAASILPFWLVGCVIFFSLGLICYGKLFAWEYGQQWRFDYDYDVCPCALLQVRGAKQ